MKYAFMSFSCPELTLAQMIDTAKLVGYDGIELRVGADHQHGVEIETDLSSRRKLRKLVETSGIPICCLATTCVFCNPQTLQENLVTTRRYIDLAADVDCSRIRVFGGQIPIEISREKAIDTLADTLARLASYARKKGVQICLETHDYWSDPRHVAAVVSEVNDDFLGIAWDIMHPVRITSLSMEESFNAAKQWIKHVHIHDGGAGTGPLTPIGKGVVDHKKAIELLNSINYKGFLSGEWIGWEPYEIHLPRELSTMKQYEKEIGIN